MNTGAGLFTGLEPRYVSELNASDRLNTLLNISILAF